MEGLDKVGVLEPHHHRHLHGTQSGAELSQNRNYNNMNSESHDGC